MPVTLRRAGTAALSAAAVVTVAGCSGQSSPDDLGSTLETAMNHKNYDIVAQLSCPQDKKKVGKYDFEKKMAKAGVTHVQYSVDYVKAAPVKNDRSVLTFTVTWENMPKELAGKNDSTDQRIPVKKLGDKWVVCSK